MSESEKKEKMKVQVNEEWTININMTESGYQWTFIDEEGASHARGVRRFPNAFDCLGDGIDVLERFGVHWSLISADLNISSEIDAPELGEKKE